MESDLLSQPKVTGHQGARQDVGRLYCDYNIVPPYCKSQWPSVQVQKLRNSVHPTLPVFFTETVTLLATGSVLLT